MSSTGAVCTESSDGRGSGALALRALEELELADPAPPPRFFLLNVHEYLAHKKTPTPWEHRRILFICLL